MKIQRIALLLAAGGALSAIAGCGGSPSSSAAPPAATAAARPAPLSPGWYAPAATAAPALAPAQVAPGAWVPGPAPGSTTGFLKLTTPATAAGVITRPAVPASQCGPSLGPATMLPVTASPGKTTATVNWQDLTDPAVLMYRIGAIPQGWSHGPGTTGTLVQATSKWQSLGATHTCNTITATVTGLASNTAYEFWLDAVHTTTVAYGIPAITQETMIGRSNVVTIR